MGQPSFSYQVIRRFILAKQFESFFDLRLLARILNDIIKGCENDRETGNQSKESPQVNSTEKAVEGKTRRRSSSWEMSDSTVLYNIDRTDSEVPKPSNEKTGNKKNFFTSDSGSDTRSSSTEDFPKKRKEKSDANPNEKNQRKEGEKTDDEEKELEKLLRMTDINPHARANTSENHKEQKEKKVSKSKEEEISLLDCLETENSDKNSSDEMEEEINKTNFFSIVNDQIKESFLLTSEESNESSAEQEEEEEEEKEEEGEEKGEGEGEEEGKKEKVKNKKKKIDEKKVERKKDDLSEFRLRFPEDSEKSGKEDSDKNGKEDSEEEGTGDSDESVKCVQVKKKKRESEEDPMIDSDSGSDIQQVYSKTESSPTKGRKNIKKILKKENLQVETKQALKMETERKKRVAERNKQFETLFPNADADSKLVLDFDPESKKEVVIVSEALARKLKPHQREGVRFMWDNCFESVKRLEEDSGSGCILAHCMGLGKTLQVITLVHTVMTHDLGVHTVLIVCPLSTVSNWMREFKTWQKPCVKKIKPFDLIPNKSKGSRLTKVRIWLREGGVLIISYGVFQSLIKDERITGFDPDLIICDEGHVLKNSHSARSKCMSEIKTLRRIVLTGTPLQNNLMEYYCMVNFVKPNILGTVKEFKNRFFHPINNGQFEDSTQLDVKIMKRRSHVLHSMLDGFIQRFGYSVLKPFLPEKQEYVISIALTETQENIYRYFIGQCNQENRELLKDFHWMQKVWTHPWVLLTHANKRGDDLMRPQWEKHVKESDYTDVRSSGKLYLLFCILKRCKDIGDKVLVFSQSLLSLDLIEAFLRNSQTEFGDNWVLGEDYFRLDGSTSSENRDAFFQKFNDVNNKRFRLFLASTKAGGLGVNLVAANRVIVFDVSWNPTHDVQSIFRVYRFGQKKPCFIYRFLAAATMEEKIYRRQVTKLSLAHRILDEHQIERHYTMGNLQELYTYDPVPKNQWKIPKLPKDGLFAEILSKNQGTIVSYHEHDSLLENKEEEELTDEDRKAAWEDYEKEKLTPEFPLVNGIPPIGIPPFNGDFLRVGSGGGGGGGVGGVGGGGGFRYNKHQGVPPNMIQNEKPLCKIVDVRTLNNQTEKEKTLEILKSIRVNAYGEKRVDRIGGGFPEGFR